MVLIIVPVKNEALRIKKTIQGISSWCKSEGLDYEILVIDDWSTDGTGNRVVELNDSRVRVFQNRFDSGKGSALKTGYILSTTIYSLYDHDIIVFIDGDGQINPKEIRTFLNMMTLYYADAVIGNKRHLYSNTQYNFKRKVISKCYNFFTRVLFGIRFQDTQCGIKMFSKIALDSVINKINVKKYAFDIELIVALKTKRYRVVDAPVNINSQENVGSVSISTILKTFIDTVIVWIKLKKRYYD